MEQLNKPRSKTFISMDSLWYEEERLSTFVEWPVPFISPSELAKDGFYYLRTKDHCACAFCRGVIGRWDEGDTARGEHTKHFPECPFVQGKVTPNVPIQQGNILSKISPELTTDVNSPGIDVCGPGKIDKMEEPCLERGLVTKSSNSKVSMSSFGFRQYCGPKRKEYLTSEVRLNTFKNWPERVAQQPKELADAGFYYCGLSDHVRCFHCGHGLRNWEPGDDPWEEHARWYPDCHFLVLQKGIDFIDKVRREKPAYFKNLKRSSSNETTASSSTCTPTVNLSTEEMTKLLELDIMKHVLDMGFSEDVVKTALRRRLETCGQPFFSLRDCIDAVLCIVDQESTSAIQEDVTAQARKLNNFDSTTNLNSTLGARFPNLSRGQISVTNSTSLNVNDLSTSFPPLPNNVHAIATTTMAPLPAFPILSRASPPLRASTPTSQMMDLGEVNAMMISSEESSGISSANSSLRGNEESEEGVDVPPPMSRGTSLSRNQNFLAASESQNSSTTVLETSPPTSDVVESQNSTPDVVETLNATLGIVATRPSSDVISMPTTTSDVVGISTISDVVGSQSTISNVVVSQTPTTDVFGSQSTITVVAGPVTTITNVGDPQTTIIDGVGSQTTVTNVAGLPTTNTDVVGSQTTATNVAGSQTTNIDVVEPQTTNVAESLTMNTVPATPVVGSQTTSSIESTTTQSESGSSQSLLNEVVVPLISEAEVLMKKAAKLLASSSGTSESSEVTVGEDVVQTQTQESVSEKKNPVDLGSVSKSEEDKDNVALELERIREKRVCKVCMDKEMEVVFLPCTHMVTCSFCAVALAACPICRRDIQYAFKPIIS